MTPEEAEREIEAAKGALGEYLSRGDIVSAENICEEFFALEPDYIDALM